MKKKIGLVILALMLTGPVGAPCTYQGNVYAQDFSKMSDEDLAIRVNNLQLQVENINLKNRDLIAEYQKRLNAAQEKAKAEAAKKAEPKKEEKKK